MTTEENKISLIIPSKNERRLNETIESALNEASDRNNIEIISITQGTGVDTQRHEGIQKASNDLLCISDAHMIFTKNWDTKLIDIFNNNPKTNIYCTQCERVTDQDFKLDDKHERHYGATVIDKCGYGIKGVSGRWIDSSFIATQEAKQEELIKIPCVLGGFYMLSKNHYIKELKEVWSVMLCYGKSEEVVSILNYKLGYDCYVIKDLNIAHLFRTGGRPPYSQDWHQMQQNAYLLAAISGDNEWQQSDLIAINGQHNKHIKSLLGSALNKYNEIEQHLINNKKRTWNEYMDYCKTFKTRA